MTTETYLISSPTIALFLEDGRHVAHLVPEASALRGFLDEYFRFHLAQSGFPFYLEFLVSGVSGTLERSAKASWSCLETSFSRARFSTNLAKADGGSHRNSALATTKKEI